VRIQSGDTASLVAALRDRNPAARTTAAQCIGEKGAQALGEALPQALEGLARLLRDRDVRVRSAAIGALGRLGPSAAPAAQALVAYLRRRRWRPSLFTVSTRWQAAAALGRIDPEAPGICPALAEALGDSDQYLRRQAAISLRKVGPQSADALPALMDALSYRAPPMPRRLKRDRQGFVHDVFGSTRAPDDAASQTMAQWRARAESEVHSVAIWALGQLGEAAAPAVPDIVRHLQQGEPTVRCTAATALGRMASARSEVVSALTDALTDDKPWVRQAAAGALGRIGPEAASAVAGLREALSDRHTRKAAVWALGKIGPSAAEAAPALVALLRDRSPRRQELAVRALQRIGPAAVPAVAQALRSGRETVRLNAAAVLGSFGPQAAPAMAALEKAMADTRPQVREALCWALRAIRGGPEASRDPGGDG
jgi:HEAT repeat protein